MKLQTSKGIENPLYRNYFSLPGLPKAKRQIKAEWIITIVSEYFNTTKELIINGNRKKPYIYYRQVTQYLLQELTDMHQKQIGDITGGKDHATVINSKKVINQLMDVYPKVAKDIETLKRMMA